MASKSAGVPVPLIATRYVRPACGGDQIFVGGAEPCQTGAVRDRGHGPALDDVTADVGRPATTMRPARLRPALVSHVIEWPGRTTARQGSRHD